MEMAIGAVIGVILFFGGMLVGRHMARPAEKLKPDDDLSVMPYDSRREKAAKMNQQYFNLMNYTGRSQIDED
ncbi:MAG: hypothetical protein ACI4NL_00615 [Christensenellales bacterium]